MLHRFLLEDCSVVGQNPLLQWTNFTIGCLCCQAARTSSRLEPVTAGSTVCRAVDLLSSEAEQISLWAVPFTYGSSAARPELLRVEPVGCPCPGDHSACWGESQRARGAAGDAEGQDCLVLHHAPAFPGLLLP